MCKKIVDYCVVDEQKRVNTYPTFALDQAVRAKIEEGFQPWGELKVRVSGAARCTVYYTQAMVKYEDD